MSRPQDADQRAATSFYWPMRLLPTDRREAMFALYAYCRGLDDVADDPGPTDAKRARLAVLRGAVAALYETGIVLDPLLVPLKPVIARFDLPKAELIALIDGMEMDVDGPIVAPSIEDLGLYCRRVAGSVGMLAVRIFGRPDADKLAVILGEALQLTNILRDVEEDAALGRVYIPGEMLERAVILTREPAALLAHPGLRRARALLGAEAEAKFDEAEAELARLGRRGLWPAAVMMATYRAQLHRLAHAGWQGPVPRLGSAARLWIALRTAVIRR